MKSTSIFRQAITFFAFTILFSISALGQTKYSFSGLGASSGGFEAITTSPAGANIRISDNAAFFSPVLYSGVSTTSAVVFTIKGDGVNTGSFTFHDMTWRPFNGSRTLTGTTVVFKRGALADVTWNLSATYQAALSFNAEVSAKTIFGESSTVTGVTEIIITADLDGSSNSDIIEFKDITLSNIVAPVVNSAPVIGGTSAGQAVNDNTTITPFSAVTIADSDGDNLTATITLDNNAKGVITGASSGSGPYTISSSTAAAMQTTLRALSFNPTDNRAAVSETTTFTVSVNDGTVSTNNSTTTVVSSAVAPSVSGISLSGSPTATATSVTYVVAFNESVVNVSTDDFTLTKGSTANGTIASVSTSSGTSINVVVNSIAGTGTLRLDLKGSTNINDTGGKGISGAFASGSTHTVDRDAPIVTSVSSSTANGTYKTGDVVAVTVTFSEAVTVTGTPQITLETGTTDRTVNYTSGSGGTTLTFNYTVQAGDVSADLDYVATNSLALNSGTINDGAGNAATLTLATPGAANSLGANKALVIDGVAPTVTSVSSSTADGTFKAGDVIAVAVTFSEAVTVTSTPQITLETGTTDRTVDYASGSGGTTLIFNYTVQAGDVSADLDYVATNSLALNSGTINDGAGNATTLTLATPGAANSLGANKAIVIDAVAPTVTSVSSSTANGTYKTGDIIAVTATFSESVTVTGTPQITLETGTTDRTVDYASGSGGTTLTFNYTVQAGDVSADLDYVATNSLALNSGTINDGAGNAATLPLATPGAANSLGANKAIVIDAVAPTVTSVSSSTANGTYKTGDIIAVTATFSESVTVTGTPQITLETGTTDRTVDYASGSGGTTLTFNYTVQAGDVSADIDYVATNSLALNSGTINDGAGNAATLTLATPGAANSLGANKAIVIDTTAPTVTTISSTTANGSYNAGDVVAVTVTFSETVTVTGTPQITLETGTTDRTVNYTSGSGGTTLTFNYTVQAGDVSADLDYVATNSLTLNSGTINDAAGNAATLTLATPGAANSLGANKAIVIDTTAPTVTTISSTTANGSYNAGDVVAVTVTFSETVTVTGTPQITLETGTTDRTADYASGSGGTTLTFNYTVQAGDASADLDYVATNSLVLNSGTINDAAGNAAALALATPGAVNSLGANKALVIDGVVPTVTSVSSSTANGTYRTGDVVAVTVTFSEVVTVTGTPQITLETGTTDRTVNYTSGSGGTTLTFNYTVQAGDESVDLDYLGTNSLALNGGTVNDGAGNVATLTLATPGAANSLRANKALVIDTSDPLVTLSVGSNSIVEATGMTTITGTLSALSTKNVTITLSYSGSATKDVDYRPTITEMTISAGSLSNTFSGATGIIALQDDLDEVGETIAIDIINVVNGSEDGVQQETITIVDDDAESTVGFNTTSSNGVESVTNVNLQVDLSAASGKNVTVDYAVTGTATGSGTDYTLANGTLTITAGNSIDNITIASIVGDVLDEADETVIVTLSNPTNATLGTNTVHTYTINDDDAAPSVAFDATASSGAETTTSTNLAVSLSAVSGQDVMVDYAVTGTATGSGTDYTLANGTLTFSAGDASKNITIASIIGDALDEDDETVIVTLSNPTSASLGTNQVHSYTILDDDATPTIAFTSTTSAGAESVANANLQVDLSAVAGRDVTVAYAITGTATGSGTDYTLGDGTLTITEGSSSKNITIASIVADLLNEDNETVVVTLSNPSNANLGVNTVHTYTITDDDAEPTVTLSQSTTTLAEAAGTNTVTATLSAASGKDVTVTIGVKAGGTATITNDFTLSTTSIVITAGNTTGIATLTAVQDALDEDNETITIEVTGVTNGSENGTQEVASSITDDDAEPAVTLTQSTTTFAEAAGTNTVTATLSAASGKDVTVTIGVKAGGTATITNDFTLSTTSIVITAGNSTGTATLTAVQDALDEDNETITIEVTGVTNGSENGTPEVASSITDDDAVPTVAFGLTADGQSESEASQDIQVSLSAKSGKTITVDYAVTGTATAGGVDHTTMGGTITFNPGDQDFQQQIVGIVDDALDEENETIILTLSNPSNASLGTNTQLTYTITDNDAAPTVTLSTITNSIAEAAGTSTVTATLSSVSGKDVTVTLGYTGTATNGTDYNNTASTTIVITAGNLSANAAVGITATQDVNPETNETIIIDITGVTNGTEDGTQQQTIIITDDDTPSVSFAATASSGAESVNSATIPVNLSIASGLTVTVNYAVTGTATGSGTDFTLANGTLTFTPAVTAQSITIAGIVDDAILEANETVIVTLSSPSNANLGANMVHTYTITNNDAAAVTIADISGNENDGAITVTATLDNAVQGGFTVDVSTADGTATTADSDYGSVTSQTLTFAGTAGETQTFTVTPTGDTKLEANETITVSQSNLAATSVSVTITDGATITINNDDAASVTIADVSGNEDDGAITVIATLDNAVDGGFTVDVNTADGTATIAGSDYTAVTSQTLTFAGTAGETQTFTVTPTTDSNAEGNETITISQGNLTATTLAVAITDGATVTINDDDDGTAPTGYSVTFDDALIGASETSASKFTFAGAEVGATYNYTVSSDGGGTNVTGTGTIATATDQVTLANLSGLSDGTLTLSVTLTDPSSNVGTAATGTTILDQTAPSAPSVTSVTSDSGTNGADGITSDNTPDANGTAEANASVEVFVDGVSAGTTTADGSGNWTMAYNGASPLSDGTILITAKASDAAGNTSTASSVLSVTVDTAAPAAPVVSSITTDSGSNGADEVTNDNTLSFNGTAEANSTVEVFAGGTSIGTTTADGSGNFSFDHTAIILADAIYSVTAKATDTAGNTSAESSAVAVTVDTTAPAAPVVGLATASDLGASTTDDLTSDNTPTLEGTAEANASVELLVDNVSIGSTTADGSGVWTLTVGSAMADGVKSITAKATDLSGNTSANSSALSITVDTSISNPTLSPVDDATGILPNANLILTFAEDVNKGTGNITIKKSSDNSTLETIDVTASTVTISGGVVTIDPVGNILPPATEFYVNVDGGALTDDAGNAYAGITNTTGWSFTAVAAPVITSVTVPADGVYGIGDNLDFIVTFSLPITMVSTYEIPLTVGSVLGTAVSQGAIASTTVTFRYTVLEDQFDSDGIALGGSLNTLSRNSSIKDEFGTDAILTLNNVSNTTSVLVDGVKPTPTISNATTTDLVNGVYVVFVEFDEPVAGFSATDLTVSNGASSNFTNLSNDTKWSFDITPTADGTVSVSLAAGVATDNVGNASVAGAAVTKTFDGTPPEVSSITRKDADQLNTATTSADFRVVFSEDVLGVDLTDFEVALTGTTGALNTVTAVDAKTYDVNVNGISGQGTVGLNVKDDDSILDNAANKLGGTGLTNGDFTGDVYTTNFLPTDITSTPASISENNAIGDIVGALTSTDTDTGDTHTYTLVSGTGDTDNASFSIDGTNLKAGAVFDFEAKDSYSIRVKTEDGNGGSFEKALTITIDNVLEASIFVSGDASFDVSALGLSQQRTLTVTNDGEKPVEVRVISSPAGFRVLPAALILTTGASAEVVVTFIPTEVRTYSGSIVFNHEGGNEAYPVSGEGAIITSTDDGFIDVSDINLYPNPASKLLTIDLSELNGSKLDIAIVNASGFPMFSREGFTEKELSLDVSGYKMGIYIIQFTNGQSVVRKKVMIKR